MIQGDSMSKDPMDTGVDLRLTQLLGEGTVGTTWPGYINMVITHLWSS
jgi:hypothetical protein